MKFGKEEHQAKAPAVFEELKNRTKTTRDVLNANANKRAARGEKLGGYLQKAAAGELDYTDVKKAAEAHAAKHDQAADTQVKAAIKQQVSAPKPGGPPVGRGGPRAR